MVGRVKFQRLWAAWPGGRAGGPREGGALRQTLTPWSHLRSRGLNSPLASSSLGNSISCTSVTFGAMYMRPRFSACAGVEVESEAVGTWGIFFHGGLGSTTTTTIHVPGRWICEGAGARAGRGRENGYRTSGSACMPKVAAHPWCNGQGRQRRNPLKTVAGTRSPSAPQFHWSAFRGRTSTSPATPTGERGDVSVTTRGGPRGGPVRKGGRAVERRGGVAVVAVSEVDQTRHRHNLRCPPRCRSEGYIGGAQAGSAAGIRQALRRKSPYLNAMGDAGRAGGEAGEGHGWGQKRMCESQKK